MVNSFDEVSVEEILPKFIGDDLIVKLFDLFSSIVVL